jgi:hypothetical protein
VKVISGKNPCFGALAYRAFERTIFLDYVFALILIIAPNCIDGDLQESLGHDLNYNNTAYEAHVAAGYQIVCMKGARIDTIESVTVPLLRQVFPDEPIVFVYGKQQERDYQLYISKKYGSEYYKTVSGNADVKLGYAMAPFNHIDIQHERAHLEMCAAHGKGANPYDPSTWTRTASRPWCPSG